MKHKDFHFDMKAFSEDGTFEGTLSTYGKIDLGRDTVEKGAFTKTLKENGSSVPMLWQHNPDLPIGSLDLMDSEDGLQCKGTLALDMIPGTDHPAVPQAHTAYSLLKTKRVKGLSIGYDAVRAPRDESGIRHLKEIRLWEGSVVTFPMDLSALIASVKAARTTEVKDDFLTELQEIQIYAARYQMMQALSESLCEILCDDDVADKPAASRDSIQQFSDAYVAMLPDYLALMATDSDMGMGWMKRPGFESKAGRVLSQANLDLIAKCITDLQALHDAATAADGAAVKGTSPEGGAKQHSIAPDELHPLLDQHLFQLREVCKWNQ